MIRLVATLAVWLVLAFGTAATAAPVRVAVRGAAGAPIADAVVLIDMPGVLSPAPHGPYAVEQRNISFEPHVLIVPVGATVAFPNRDRVRHHVYSFSAPKRFNLKLYGREEERTVLFDRPGVIALGCNIHDGMTGFIIVASTPFAVRTDATGTATLPNLPPGRGTLRVWHPSIRQPGNMVSQPVLVPAAGLTTQVVLRP